MLFGLFIFSNIVSLASPTINIDYKSFNSQDGENNNSEITRKASIKIGKKNYDIEIKQNKNIYLFER